MILNFNIMGEHLILSSYSINASLWGRILDKFLCCLLQLFPVLNLSQTGGCSAFVSTVSIWWVIILYMSLCSAVGIAPYGASVSRITSAEFVTRIWCLFIYVQCGNSLSRSWFSYWHRQTDGSTSNDPVIIYSLLQLTGCDLSFDFGSLVFTQINSVIAAILEICY